MTIPHRLRLACTFATAVGWLAAGADGQTPVRNPMVPPTTSPIGHSSSEHSINPIDGPVIHRAPATTAPAAARVANPMYTAMAQSAVGSSATFSVDRIDLPTSKPIHVTITLTIKAVSADAVTAAATSTADKPPGGGMEQQVPARVEAADVDPHGRETVTAMGKPFACDVYSVAPTVLDSHMPKGGSPLLKLYLSADAPGGLVKLTVPEPGGQEGVMLLTGSTAAAAKAK